MKRLIITIAVLTFFGGLFSGCQEASRTEPGDKGMLSSENKQNRASDDQVKVSAGKRIPDGSYNEAKFSYNGPEYTH